MQGVEPFSMLEVYPNLLWWLGREWYRGSMGVRMVMSRGRVRWSIWMRRIRGIGICWEGCEYKYYCHEHKKSLLYNDSISLDSHC